MDDVLVSNDTTYFGAVELPNAAHTEYMANKDVATAIVRSAEEHAV